MSIPAWYQLEETWNRAFREEGLGTAKPFLEIDVDHGGDPDRAPEMSWWPITDLDTNLYDLVRHFILHPGTLGPVHGSAKSANSRGSVNTLGVIRQFGARSLMPFMTAASLEGVDLDALGLGDEQSAIFDEIQTLSHAWICGTGLEESPWAYPIKATLPEPIFPGHRLQFGAAKIDHDVPGLRAIADHDDAMRWLAKRHAGFFKRWQAVEIRFTADLSPKWRKTRDSVAKIISE